jgi:ribosomal protein S18 acetylase RimI-like enzyme
MSGDLLQRVWQVLRREGIRSFLFKLLDVLGYRRLFLLGRSLAEPIPDVQTALPLTMNWLTNADSAEYFALRPSADADQIAVTWAAASRAWTGYLEHELPLAPGEVYLFDAYTDPAFRGHGIAPAMSTELLRRFRGEDSRRAIRGTWPENEAALRAHAKAGFQPYAIIRCIKLGPWRGVWQREL